MGVYGARSSRCGLRNVVAWKPEEASTADLGAAKHRIDLDVLHLQGKLHCALLADASCAGTGTMIDGARA